MTWRGETAALAARLAEADALREALRLHSLLAAASALADDVCASDDRAEVGLHGAVEVAFRLATDLLPVIEELAQLAERIAEAEGVA